MATSKRKQPESPPEPGPLYPTLEGLIEKASADELADAFTQLKADLAALKGPRAEQGKKVLKAVERTEELLSYLLQVREKIQADRKGGARGRR
jgi:hypothetical protein